jgi:hypothetical protein
MRYKDELDEIRKRFNVVTEICFDLVRKKGV